MEIVQSKLSVYEENPTFGKMGNNDFSEYEKIGMEDLQDKI